MLGADDESDGHSSLEQPLFDTDAEFSEDDVPWHRRFVHPPVANSKGYREHVCKRRGWGENVLHQQFELAQLQRQTTN